MTYCVRVRNIRRSSLSISWRSLDSLKTYCTIFTIFYSEPQHNLRKFEYRCFAFVISDLVIMQMDSEEMSWHSKERRKWQ